MRAHPRSRGENIWGSPTAGTYKGSSPLTRGKRCAPSPASGLTGLIPAHAGKTRRQWNLHLLDRAHPRSRGENINLVVSALSGWGSSPLTRGKPRRRTPRRAHTGLIPAHAGKTCSEVGEPFLGRAHPRSRGENNVSQTCENFAQGSSPLTRGKPGALNDRSHPAGLIPAHAGKTAESFRSRPEWRAHPRSRGENDATNKFADTLRGSSPLTRGKRRSAVRLLGHDGLIPAHAGKTSLRHTSRAMYRAHPRSRGENSSSLVASGSTAGSSPLTRGKHVASAHHADERGLIPAHAGKT